MQLFSRQVVHTEADDIRITAILPTRLGRWLFRKVRFTVRQTGGKRGKWTANGQCLGYHEITIGDDDVTLVCDDGTTIHLTRHTTIRDNVKCVVNDVLQGRTMLFVPETLQPKLLRLVG